MFGLYLSFCPFAGTGQHILHNHILLFFMVKVTYIEDERAKSVKMFGSTLFRLKQAILYLLEILCFENSIKIFTFKINYVI